LVRLDVPLVAACVAAALPGRGAGELAICG